MTFTALLQGIAVVLALEGLAYAIAPGFMRRMLASPPVAARRPGSPRNPSADGIIHCRAGCDSGAQAIACGVEGAHGVGMRMGL